MARVYKPLADKECVAIYRSNKGLDGVAKSQKVLAAEYEVGVARIAASIKHGATLCSVDASASVSDTVSVVGANASGKSKAKTADSGVTGLTIKQILRIQELFDGGEGMNQSQLAREFDVGRHKIKKALAVKVSEHENGVKSAGTDYIEEPHKQPLGSMVAFTDDAKDEDVYTIVGVDVNDPDEGAIILARVDEGSCLVDILEAEDTVMANIKDEDVFIKLFPVGINQYISSIIATITRAINEKSSLVMRNGDHIAVDPNQDMADVSSVGEFTDAEGRSHIYTDVDAKATTKLHGDVEHRGFDADTSVKVDHTQEKLLEGVTEDAPQCMVLPDQIMIVIDGEPKSIPKDHDNFNRLAKAIKDKDWATAKSLVDVAKAINEYSRGLLKIQDGVVEFDGEKILHQGFTQRMLAMLQSGDNSNVDRLANFLDKVMDNPSNNIVNRIFDFMKFADVEIAEDGDIIAYKGVKGNYKDGHSGKISNTPGSVVTMRRNRVNEKQEQTCSYGLHVCALSYLPQMSCFGGSGNKIVRVKLSPTDIVSIPTDYKDAKIRCCRYEVLEDVTSEYRSGTLKIDREGMFAAN
ncbi:RIIB protein [Vibrio phage 1.244.A._10N.261.54.C3]|nr:RIIB protein [Vibrio phage 1.244.A._10N.261.54.C3]AUR98794.1 RIIB protein [Vibrio phage 1.255.O._10N.286.45.F1]